MKEKLTIVICFFIVLCGQLIDGNEDLGWIWLSGNNIGNQISHLNQNISNSKEFSNPGSRAEAASWFDRESKVLWIFGGIGFDEKQTDIAHVLGDLWYFTHNTMNWTQVETEYEIKVVKTTKRIQPKPRKGASMCGVSNTLLVLYGGADSQNRALHDTWLFDIPKLSWLPLNVKYAHKKVHLNTPGARYNAATWCTENKFVVFGGRQNSGASLDDMWIFSFQNFTWESKSQHIQIDSIRKELNDPFPIARTGAITWVDEQENLYLYGGNNEKSANDLSLLGDMWAYSFNSETWNLLLENKSHLINQNTNNETKPSSRMNAISWRNMNNNLLLYGGVGQSSLKAVYFSDLWEYNINKNQWSALIANGNYSYNMPSVTPYLINKIIHPTGRAGALHWTCNDSLFMSHGIGEDHMKKISFLNDMYVLVNNISSIVLNTRSLPKRKGLSPGKVFIFSLTTFGGAVLLFGAVFFFKKMVDFPRHQPKHSYNVKYSPLDDGASFDM